MSVAARQGTELAPGAAPRIRREGMPVKQDGCPLPRESAAFTVPSRKWSEHLLDIRAGADGRLPGAMADGDVPSSLPGDSSSPRCTGVPAFIDSSVVQAVFVSQNASPR